MQLSRTCRRILEIEMISQVAFFSHLFSNHFLPDFSSIFIFELFIFLSLTILHTFFISNISAQKTTFSSPFSFSLFSRQAEISEWMYDSMLLEMELSSLSFPPSLLVHQVLRHLRRAVELDQSDEILLLFYGSFLIQCKRLAEANDILLRCVTQVTAFWISISNI